MDPKVVLEMVLILVLKMETLDLVEVASAAHCWDNYLFDHMYFHFEILCRCKF